MSSKFINRLGGILVLAVILGVLPSLLADVFEYSESNGQITITGYADISNDLVIPSTIDGYPVTSIGDWAFGYCSDLTSVTIPDSVTNIGDWAFEECENLTSVSIGAGVITMGEYPFDLCTSLIEFVVSENNPAYSSNDGVLFNKAQTVLLLFPAGRYGAYRIPHGVTSIGAWAFDECYLDNVLIPDSVTSIGEGAFSYCEQLYKIVIPNGVTSIGDWAFEGCSYLETVIFGDGLISLGEYAFQDCHWLSNIHLPDSLTEIKHRTFANCGSLQLLRLGHNLKLIGEEAFSACIYLRNIFLPESLSEIDDNAFADCKQLRMYFLGEPVILGENSFPADSTMFYREGTPGWEEFVGFNKVMLPLDNSDNFEYVIEQGQATITGYKRKDSTEGEISLVCVPQTIEGYPVVSIADYAFSNNMMEKWTYDHYNPLGFCGPQPEPGMLSAFIVILPDGISYIGKSAFSYCYWMIECELPGNLLYIGADAFADCDNLHLAALPENISVIGAEAFSGITHFRTLALPKSLLYIGEGFLRDCDNLTAITVDYDNAYYFSSDDGVLFNKDKTELIQFPAGRQQEHYTVPEGVVHIGTGAFAGCKLQSVAFPDSLISIGDRAFAECRFLATLEFAKGLQSIGEEAFSECYELTDFSLPESLLSIAEKAFYECYNLTDIKVPDSVTRLGAGAFIGCENLRSLTLGKGLTRIEDSVFYECYSLPYIIIPPNVTHVNPNAFLDYENARGLILQGKVNFESFEHPYTDDRDHSLGDDYYAPLGKIYCLAEPPEIDNYWFGEDNVFYYIGDAPGWEDLEAIKARGFRRIIKLPAGTEIPPLAATNNDFTEAISLEGEKGQTVGNTAGCDSEDYEPDSSGNSACWRWTAPKDGMVQFNTFGGTCEYETLTVYTVTEPDSLGTIISSTSEYYNGITQTNKVIFEVEKGREYYIAVGVGEWEDASLFILSWFYVDKAGDFIYTIENRQATLVAYTGSESELEIPAIFDGAPLNAIGDAAFAENEVLTKVVVPKRVTSIGEEAFLHCRNLKEVTLQEGLTTIGREAFRSTGLEGISIPHSVILIGAGSFAGCESLATINLQEGLTSIGKKAFVYTAFEEITIPDSVTSIGVDTFGGCWELRTVNLGKGLSKIETLTFADCENLESIIIPTNIQLIEQDAFDYSGVTLIVLQGQVTIEHYAFYDEEEDSSLKAIYCQAGPPILKTNAIPPDTIIYYWEGNPEWEGITSLRGHQVIMLPKNSEIPQPPYKAANDNFADAIVITGERGYANGDNSNCTREDGEPEEYTEASIWWKWKAPKTGEVRFDVFRNPDAYYGESFFAIYEGNTLDSLDVIAASEDFYWHPTQVTFSATEGEEYHIAFASRWRRSGGKVKFIWFYEEDANDFIVDFINGQAIIARYIGSDNEVEIPKNIAGFPVTAIGAHAFFEQRQITRVYIPGPLSRIDEFAFAGCYNLNEIVFPDGLVSIGRGAFRYSALEAVSIPDSVTSIGRAAFSACDNLQSVTLGKGLVEIEAETFADCWSLEEIFIPENIKFIRQGAFSWCDSLTSVTLAGIVHIESGAFISLDLEELMESIEYRLALHCLGGPPVLEGFPLPYGAVIYHRTGRLGWESVNYLQGYQVRNIDATSNPVIFILFPQGTHTGGGELRQQIAYGQAAVAPEISGREQWNFTGWDKDFSMVTKPLFVTAQFERVKYQVVFELGAAGTHFGGGDLSQEVEYGAAAIAPDVMPAEGYAFEGWDADFSRITTSLTVRAIYSYEQALALGWNLIGVKLVLNDDSQKELTGRRAMSLAPSGKAYVLGTDVAAPQACWIYCQKAETFSLSGTSPENSIFAASLKKGWNFITPLLDHTLSGDDAFAWTWNEESGTLEPGKDMSSGRGYFLYWPDN